MPAAPVFPQLIADFVVYLGLFVRRRKAIAAENLFLRRQLALYQERKVDPRRIDPATRITFALLSRFFNWRDALIVVQPKTLIRWHRAGFRLLWHWKSKPGRPPIPAELRRLLREMSRDNSLWGEERIANELLVKLGIKVSPRTVRKYMRRKPGRGTSRRSALAHLSAQSRSGHRRLRFLCGGHGELSRSIHLCDHRARLTPSAPLQCDVESDGSLDVAAVARGDRL
jgi:hypothetical protein